MRISDWSSDVCSSDLIGRRYRPVAERIEETICLARAVQELLGADVAEHQPHGLVCGLREIGIGFDTRRDHHPCRAVAADHHRRRRDLDAEALAEFGTALEIHLCDLPARLLAEPFEDRPLHPAIA